MLDCQPPPYCGECPSCRRGIEKTMRELSRREPDRTLTPEAVVAEAFTKTREPEYLIPDQDDRDDAEIAVNALREHGMLVEGDLTDELITRAVKAVLNADTIIPDGGDPRGDAERIVRAVLSVVRVVPPVVNKAALAEIIDGRSWSWSPDASLGQEIAAVLAERQHEWLGAGA